MKFKFCDEGDCPLWALAGLHALGSLPAARLRLIVASVLEEQPEDNIMEILKDTSLSSRDECARAAATVRWVMRQAWRNSCSGAQLSKDLLVLGVPRTHAVALSEAVDEGKSAHEAQQHSNGFMINKLADVSASPGPEGSIDTIKLSLHVENTFTGSQKQQDLLIDRTQAKSLLEELKKAKSKMEEIDRS